MEITPDLIAEALDEPEALPPIKVAALQELERLAIQYPDSYGRNYAALQEAIVNAEKYIPQRGAYKADMVFDRAYVYSIKMFDRSGWFPEDPYWIRFRLICSPDMTSKAWRLVYIDKVILPKLDLDVYGPKVMIQYQRNIACEFLALKNSIHKRPWNNFLHFYVIDYGGHTSGNRPVLISIDPAYIKTMMDYDDPVQPPGSQDEVTGMGGDR